MLAFILLVTLLVTGIRIQQKVIDVQDTPRLENPLNLCYELFLLLIICDASQDSKQDHCITTSSC